MKKKSTSQSAFFRLRSIPFLLCVGIACSVLTGTLLAFIRAEAPAKVSYRTLTFAERVDYQRAIEEVYWRHRIWPKERPDPKPSLDEVIPSAQLEKKVEDYLRNSQALEDYWQQSLSAEQLQAEMERMAQHTKQPEVLRELFEALGNDPFVIAECLARPALSERLVTNFYAYDQRFHGELRQRAEAELQTHPTVEQMKQTLPAAASRSDAGAASGTYSEIELVRGNSAEDENNRGAEHGVKLNNREWDKTVQKLAATYNKPSATKASAFGVQRTRPVWTFESAVISAHSKNAVAEDYEAMPIGKLSSLQEDASSYYATALLSKAHDRLKIATVAWNKEPLKSWRPRAENQVPTAIAALSGNYTLPTISDGAGGCIDDTWTPTPSPPDGRDLHTAVWTGAEMIVWGGYKGIDLDSGGRYNPSTDSWTATSTTNAPVGRYNHTAVWTGSEMIVWGGYDGSSDLNSGGKYNPGTDSWTVTSIVNAPAARESHTAVWTGNEMIVWGGYDGISYFNTGGRYDPATDSWTATPTANAPLGRLYHTALWTGAEMIVWGGYNGTNLDTGGKYDPSTDSWTATSTTNAPTGRRYHTAVWTGSEMIVWGVD